MRAGQTVSEGAVTMHTPERHFTILGIICVAAAVFFLQNVSDGPPTHTEYGVIPVKVGYAWTALLHGDFGAATWRVLLTTVTGLFLHGGAAHLIMNMVFLWMFGSLISQYLGQWWALASFFVCGIGGFVVATDLGLPCQHPNMESWHKHRWWGLVYCTSPCINGIYRLTGPETWYDQNASDKVIALAESNASLKTEFANRVFKNHDYEFLHVILDQAGVRHPNPEKRITTP